MSTSLLSSPYAVGLGAFVFLYFIVYPVVVYFRDLNGQWPLFTRIHSILADDPGD